jgi:hypothetical protein
MRTLMFMISIGLVAITPNTLLSAEQDYEYVSKVHVHQDNYGYINVKGNLSPIHGCKQLSYARTEHDLSDKKAEMELRIAATSFVTKSPVHIRTEGCSPDGYPLLTEIQVQETYTPTTPSCPSGQRRCADGNCVPNDQLCPCPAGQRRCMNLEPPRCVPSNQPCPTTP